MTRYHWTERAICTKIADRDIWFSSIRADIKQAKLACQSCPVIQKCAEQIARLESDGRTEHGVWAARTPHQRTGRIPVGSTSVIICATCGLEAPLRANGLCGRCYDHARRSKGDAA